MRSNKLLLETITVSAFVLSLGLAAPAQAAETTGQYLDDATITTKVKAALLQDDQLKDTSISVETDKASVHLTGMVNSKAQANEAIRVANKVDGVKSVMDHIAVRSSQSQ
jgi:hyperosmotically inducible protein